MQEDFKIFGQFKYKISKSEEIRDNKDRGVDLETLIIGSEYIETIENKNPKYEGQEMMILNYKNKPWVLIYREKGEYFEIATAYPKSKLKKKYKHIFKI